VPIFVERMSLRAILTISFLICVTQISAQEQNTGEVKRVIKYGLEAGTIISSNGETPFWLRANQYGTVPLTSPIFTLGGSVSSDYKKAVTKEDQYKLSKFDWGYGLNIVGNVGKENQFLIPEAYLKAKFGAFEIYAGRRKEIVGLVDTTLSSGSYIWSGNALPMPKVQISTPNFVPLGFTGGFLSFKGSYAHGWFENSRTDVKNFFLHQKTLYFRLGKPDWKFHFYGGFNHQVQWGGELLYPDPKNQYAINGQVGSSFDNYINVVTGRSNGAEGDTTKIGINDATNRSGNHLGTIDFGFEINAKTFSLLVYRQNIYDDGSLALLGNISDGLNGVSINIKKRSNSSISVQRITFEYLNTISQGGAVSSDATNSRLRGQDNYFNNGVYRNGWTYNQTSFGTGFINNVFVTNPLSIYFNNNRVQAFYIGLTGLIGEKIKTEIRISNSKNFGIYNDLFDKPKEQFSGLLKLSKLLNKFDNTTAFLNIAFDSGSLFSSSFGGYLGIKKEW
jgi:hypothetical protein